MTQGLGQTVPLSQSFSDLNYVSFCLPMRLFCSPFVNIEVEQHMQKKEKPYGLWLLGVLVCLFLCSCSGETPVKKASRDGILIMGNTAEPKGLDPHIVSGVLESNIIRALFEGLVGAHPSKDGVALPGVAEKWYPTNEDRPDEWVFELRKDAQWSDGAPLTADDFLFAFRRLLTPDLASDYSFMLYYIRDAEPYHKSQRSYLLSRDDANFTDEWWASLKEVDFGPNEEAEVRRRDASMAAVQWLTLTRAAMLS
jgi:hypothetical protein